MTQMNYLGIIIIIIATKEIKIKRKKNSTGSNKGGPN